MSYTSYNNNTITYTFGDYQGLGNSYECGQYANGDWWVLAKGSPAGVTITSMTPAFSNGKNGYDVNPRINQNHLDNNTRYYAGAPAALPRDFITNGQILSIIKAISAPEEGDGSFGYKCISSGNDKNSRSCLQFIAVLTVVEQTPSNSSDLFRPAYVRTGKTEKEFRVSQLDLSYVGQFSANCCSGRDTYTSFTHVRNRYRWVQTDHLNKASASEQVHAQDNYNSCYHSNINFPNSYGGCVASVNGTSALRFLLDDFDFNTTTHKEALIGYVQAGIDLWALTEIGIGWNTTRSGHTGPTPFLGGHFNGRKIVVTFAAALLSDPDLTAAAGADFYSENDQVYFSTVAQRPLFGEPGALQGYLDGLRQDCGGNAPNGSKVRSDWQNPSVRDPQGWIDGAVCTNNDYQTNVISMPYAYTALAVRMMGAESQFNHDPLWDYAKRWREHGKWTQPDGWSGRSFNAASFHGTHKADGGYKTNFGEQMWAAFRNIQQKGSGSQSITVEAEDMTLNGFIVDNGQHLQGSGIMVDPNGAGTGTAISTFTGTSGSYTVILSVIPEQDGQPLIKMFIGTNKIIDEVYPVDPSYFSLVERIDYTVTGVSINKGDVITMEGTSDSLAFTRVDKITFVSASTSVGINEVMSAVELSLRPFSNPVIRTVTFNSNTGGVLFIYDNSGQLITQIIPQAGSDSYRWDGTEVNGRSVKPGVYMYSLTTDGQTASGKIVYVR